MRREAPTPLVPSARARATQLGRKAEGHAHSASMRSLTRVVTDVPTERSPTHHANRHMELLSR